MSWTKFTQNGKLWASKHGNKFKVSHPHIVQFFGAVYSNDESIPIGLLMEAMGGNIVSCKSFI